MDPTPFIGWGVSLATGLYLIHFKNQTDKRKTDDERRLSALEKNQEENLKRVQAIEVSDALRQGELKTLASKHDDIKRSVDEIKEKMVTKELFASLKEMIGSRFDAAIRDAAIRSGSNKE